MSFYFVCFVYATCISCGSSSSNYVAPVLTAFEQEWETIHQAERNGQLAKAVAGYKLMCEYSRPYRRACYDYSRLLFKLEKDDEARIVTADYIKKYPDSSLSQVASKRLAQNFIDKKKLDDGLLLLSQLAKSIYGKDAWDSVLYETARLYKIKGAISQEKITLLQIVEGGRWGSQLWDNSMWRLIKIAQNSKNTLKEEQLLKQMLSARESSWFIASYNSPYYDKALLRLGQLLFEQARFKEAHKVFIELAKWKTSRLRDDGFLWAAKVSFKQNKKRRACNYLKTIFKDMPAANTRKKALKLYQKQTCNIN